VWTRGVGIGIVSNLRSQKRRAAAARGCACLGNACTPSTALFASALNPADRSECVSLN
jgi:hypothetical protein